MVQAARDVRRVPVSPLQTARAAARVAPATSADASCIPAKTGLSGVPSPYRPLGRPSRPAWRTASMYPASCTSSSSAGSAGAGVTTVTPGRASTPSSRASAMVSSTRTGASGCPGPKSYPVSRSSQTSVSEPPTIGRRPYSAPSSRPRSRAASMAARNAARTPWFSSSLIAEIVVPPGEVTASRRITGCSPESRSMVAAP